MSWGYRRLITQWCVVQRIMAQSVSKRYRSLQSEELRKSEGG